MEPASIARPRKRGSRPRRFSPPKTIEPKPAASLLGWPCCCCCSPCSRSLSSPTSPRSRIRLQILAFELISDVIASARRNRHHRQRGVLAALRDETCAVGDE